MPIKTQPKTTPFLFPCLCLREKESALSIFKSTSLSSKIGTSSSKRSNTLFGNRLRCTLISTEMSIRHFRKAFFCRNILREIQPPPGFLLRIRSGSFSYSHRRTRLPRICFSTQRTGTQHKNNSFINSITLYKDKKSNEQMDKFHSLL